MKSITKNTQYLGFDCVELCGGNLALTVTQSIGPRLISLRLDDGPNLFAELPGVKFEHPESEPFYFYGGHRLWHAPEVPERTYLPDNLPVKIEPLFDGVQVTQPQEVQTGLEKSMRIRFTSSENVVSRDDIANNEGVAIIDHVLANRGLWAVECAPWAITQLRPGGIAILPQNRVLADPDGLQPNRSVVLWPYTKVRSPHIVWGDGYIRIESTPETGPLKVGFPNPRGWLAYHIEDTLFVKYAHFLPDEDYYDLGSSSQCYCRFDFLELETLGPRTLIPPGKSVMHREVWRVFGNVSLGPTAESIQKVVDRLLLDRVPRSMDDFL